MQDGEEKPDPTCGQSKKKKVQSQIFGSIYTIIEMNINFITSRNQIDIATK